MKERKAYNKTEYGKRKSLKAELWKNAHEELTYIYGDMPDVRILNRFYSEKMLFENSDYIMMWELVARLRLRARELSCITKLCGADSATFSAFLLGATETNPLPLHYRCPACKRVELIKEKALPWDMPDKICECGGVMRADGFDIPCEMTLSRSFGPWPHLAVDSKFIEAAEEIIREKMGGLYRICKLTKKDFNILKFVFLPLGEGDDYEETVDAADDRYNSYPQITVTTSVALDSAKRLAETTDMDFCRVAEVSDGFFTDSRIISAFKNGDVEGIPDFCEMRQPCARELKAVSPESSHDLLQYLGAMHGTNTWWNNAERLVKDGICKIGDIPSHRDDVFMLLRDKLKEAGHTDVGIAHNIATKIRLGAYARVEMSAEDRALLEYLDLPEWFIPYAERIEYMSSKANTVETLRISLAFMWYKVNYPDKFKEALKK